MESESESEGKGKCEREARTSGRDEKPRDDMSDERRAYSTLGLHVLISINDGTVINSY